MEHLAGLAFRPRFRVVADIQTLRSRAMSTPAESTWIVRLIGKSTTPSQYPRCPPYVTQVSGQASKLLPRWQVPLSEATRVIQQPAAQPATHQHGQQIKDFTPLWLSCAKAREGRKNKNKKQRHGKRRYLSHSSEENP